MNTICPIEYKPVLKLANKIESVLKNTYANKSACEEYADNGKRLLQFFHSAVQDFIEENPVTQNTQEKIFYFQHRLENVADILCPKRTDDKVNNFYALYESFEIFDQLYDADDLPEETEALSYGFDDDFDDEQDDPDFEPEHSSSFILDALDLGYKYENVFKRSADYLLDPDQAIRAPQLSSEDIDGMSTYVYASIIRAKSYLDEYSWRTDKETVTRLHENFETIINRSAYLNRHSERLQSKDIKATICALYGYTARSLQHVCGDNGVSIADNSFLVDQTSQALLNYSVGLRLL